MKVKWRKGWEVVDEVKGGYAETAYECFDIVPDIPLLKSKTGGEYGILGICEKAKSRRWIDCFLMSRKHEKHLTA